MIGRLILFTYSLQKLKLKKNLIRMFFFADILIHTISFRDSPNNFLLSWRNFNDHKLYVLHHWKQIYFSGSHMNSMPQVYLLSMCTEFKIPYALRTCAQYFSYSINMECNYPLNLQIYRKTVFKHSNEITCGLDYICLLKQRSRNKGTRWLAILSC
mgnify:CR=1 FL=1